MLVRIHAFTREFCCNVFNVAKEINTLVKRARLKSTQVLFWTYLVEFSRILRLL